MSCIFLSTLSTGRISFDNDGGIVVEHFCKVYLLFSFLFRVLFVRFNRTLEFEDLMVTVLKVGNRLPSGLFKWVADPFDQVVNDVVDSASLKDTLHLPLLLFRHINIGQTREYTYICYITIIKTIKEIKSENFELLSEIINFFHKILLLLI